MVRPVSVIMREYRQSTVSSIAVFDELLSYLRLEVRHVSLDVIADRCNMHPNTLARWMSGDTKYPRTISIMQVAEYFGLELQLVAIRSKTIKAKSKIDIRKV
jgi:transcriptional regulator with XRE-family HTH domain